MQIKAPYIITLEGPVLKDHVVCVENGMIQQIRPQKEVLGECVDLPQTILLPGLVNCHCHLELSELPEPLPYPGSFVKWIEELGRLKLKMSPQQVEASIRYGIQKTLEGGTTTIADHLSPQTPLQPLLDSPLDGVAYLEVLGVEEERANYFYQEALKTSTLRHFDTSNFSVIPTPHAPYSLLPEIFSKVVTIAPSHHRTIAPLSIHISESAEEYLLFKEGRGPLFEFLAAKGKTPPTIGETPLHYLHRLKLLAPKMMAIHANYLEENDIALLKKYQMSVVHCPGSHRYFEYDRFPLGMLLEAGINVALGTDSLASNPSLSMLEQMRLMLDSYAELTPEAVLKMATLHGAKALGREKEKPANLIGVPLSFPNRSLLENILFAEKPSWLMIRGQVLPSF